MYVALRVGVGNNGVVPGAWATAIAWVGVILFRL